MQSNLDLDVNIGQSSPTHEEDVIKAIARNTASPPIIDDTFNTKQYDAPNSPNFDPAPWTSANNFDKFFQNTFCNSFDTTRAIFVSGTNISFMKQQEIHIFLLKHK